jgi:hypothetical protein
LLGPGETFYSDIDEHLWVVVTEPDADDRVVCVCFLTQRAWTDPTTLCEVGEHPFFKEPTVVGYNFAAHYKVKRITKNIECGSFTKKQRCSSVLLEKIRDGVSKSDRTPKYVLAALRKKH